MPVNRCSFKNNIQFKTFPQVVSWQSRLRQNYCVFKAQVTQKRLETQRKTKTEIRDCASVRVIVKFYYTVKNL